MSPAANFTAEWFTELAERLSRVTVGASGSIRLSLGQVISEPGDRETSYTLSFGGGIPTTVEPGIEHADVVLSEDEATAHALLSGEPAGAMLAKGKVKVRGDVNALLAAADALVELGAALGAP